MANAIADGYSRAPVGDMDAFWNYLVIEDDYGGALDYHNMGGFVFQEDFGISGGGLDMPPIIRHWASWVPQRNRES